MEMARYWIVLLLIGLLAGCGETRMARPEDPEGRYRDQIVTARRLLEQAAFQTFYGVVSHWERRSDEKLGRADVSDVGVLSRVKKQRANA